MTIYFFGTAVCDTLFEGSIHGPRTYQLGGGAYFAALACKAAAPNQEVFFIGEIGNDEVGQQFQSSLTSAGVKFLPELADAENSSEAIWIVNKGNKTHHSKKLVEPRKDTAEIIGKNIIPEADDYFVMQSMTTTENLDKYLDSFRRAKAAGATISFSCNTRPFVDLKTATPAQIEAAKNKRNKYFENYEYQRQHLADLMITSQAELNCLFFDKTAKDIQTYLSGLTLPTIVTRRIKSSQIYYRTPDPIVNIPVEEVVGLKNLVGSGDIFLGNLIGTFANAGVNHKNMTPEILGCSANIAQHGTRSAMAWRRKLENPPDLPAPPSPR